MLNRDYLTSDDNAIDFSTASREDLDTLKHDLKWFLRRIAIISDDELLEEVELLDDQVYITVKDYDGDRTYYTVPDDVFFSNSDIRDWLRERDKERLAEEQRKREAEQKAWAASHKRDELATLKRLMEKYKDEVKG